MAPHSFWEQLANVPWVAYALFFLVVRSSYRLSKPSIIPVRLLSLTLTLLVLITISSIAVTPSHLLIILPVSATGITFGILTGWKLYNRQQVRAIKNKKKLYLPGSYQALIILSAFLGIQVLGYIVHLNRPEWQSNLFFSLTWHIVCGFFSGLFIGRLAYASRCLKAGPFIDEADAILKTTG